MRKKIIQYSTVLLLIACHQIKRENVAKNVNINIEDKIKILKLYADSLYENSDYVRAKIYFDTLIQLDPKNGELYAKRGYSIVRYNERTGDQESISDYLKSIELGYKRADCYFNLGLAY